MSKKIPACLAGAGLLGHTWFVTAKTAEGGERLYMQCSEPAHAVQGYDDLGDKAANIYQRTGHGKYKRVSYSAAVIA